MKKIIQIMIVLIFSAIGIFAIANIIDKNKSNRIIEDTKKFKTEYESLNGKSQDSIKYTEVKVDDEIRVSYLEDDEIIDSLTSGSSIVFFGSRLDNNSRTVLNILLESMKETYYKELKYYNSTTLVDELKLDENNKIVIVKHGKKIYSKIINILDKYLSPYDGLNDSTIKKLEIPTLVFIHEGEVVGFYDIKKIDISNIKDIKQSIIKGIHKVLNDLCDESC